MGRRMKFLWLLPLLLSCENNMDDVQRISFNKASPDEVIVDFNMTYSEGGKAKVKIYAAYSESFRTPEYITYLKDSLRVTFYAEDGQKISTLTAKYGKINHEKDEILIKDSVRFYHLAKKQLLKTELIQWHRKDSTISTQAPVFIMSPSGNFSGKGLKARQDFSSYEILRPQGDVVIEKENELN